MIVLQLTRVRINTVWNVAKKKNTPTALAYCIPISILVFQLLFHLGMLRGFLMHAFIPALSVAHYQYLSHSRCSIVLYSLSISIYFDVFLIYIKHTSNPKGETEHKIITVTKRDKRLSVKQSLVGWQD